MDNIGAKLKWLDQWIGFNKADLADYESGARRHFLNGFDVTKDLIKRAKDDIKLYERLKSLYKRNK